MSLLWRNLFIRTFHPCKFFKFDDSSHVNFFFTQQIETHENKINNTPIICDLCEYRTFNLNNYKAHLASRHQQKKKTKEKSLNYLTLNQQERRKLIVEAYLDDTTQSWRSIAKKLKLPKSTVGNVLKRHQSGESIDRKAKLGRRRGPADVELNKKICLSLSHDPNLSDSARAKKFGVSRGIVRRARVRYGVEPLLKKKPKKKNELHQTPRIPDHH